MGSTREVLNTMTEAQVNYLRRLKENVKIGTERDQHLFSEQAKATARGYIRGLIDSGVLEENDFRTVWCWFTL